MHIPSANSPVRLIQVTSENNNKYYNMTPMGDTFLAEWGRIGVTKDSKSYPISKWDSTYKSKVYRKDKPYKDVTHLVKESAKTSTHRPIQNIEVASLIDTLMAYAKKSVTDNYTISSDAVTITQVNEAQAILNGLLPLVEIGSDKDPINKALLDLYAVIPRRMNNVKNYLVSVPSITTADELQTVRALVDGEQKTLDVMAGQVQIGSVDSSNASPEHTMLDTLGITVEVGTPSDVTYVRNMMGVDARELRNVYVVRHLVGDRAFHDRLKAPDAPANKAVEYFWHGSRNENWISILQTGLKIRPSNAVLTGAMFGSGIYFADKYRKSAGYTSLSGSYWTGGSSKKAFLSIMKVHVGKQLEVTRHSSVCYGYNADYLQRQGQYDSVFAKGGYDLRNNEYIVYKETQSTIQYLVEVGV